LRIDHLLLSPSLAGRLVAAGVDRDVRARERSSDHLARNTIIESSFEVGRRFRCTMRIDCGQLDPGAVIRPDAGEWHPIKPDNLGVARVAGSGAYRLVLFDFSLSRTPPENIEAGTRPYLDPFLANRGPPPRWDLYAERYAAAVTLHEMMAGVPPVFGDGVTDPLVTDDEATIAAERFDPVLRDGLTAFFDRALQRDPAERFGNAEEMLRAWGQAFEPMDETGVRSRWPDRRRRPSPQPCRHRAASS
jgi:serine/threonine protein kinase